ncbi:uncharacterized protein [Cherax quadricarinatus]|uniref:uncharacterized protein n=1 Tax=Cherax quadricarinatus TaxID=27406 RepID=UPI00387E27CF
MKPCVVCGQSNKRASTLINCHFCGNWCHAPCADIPELATSSIKTEKCFWVCPNEENLWTKITRVLKEDNIKAAFIENLEAFYNRWEHKKSGLNGTTLDTGHVVTNCKAGGDVLGDSNSKAGGAVLGDSNGEAGGAVLGDRNGEAGDTVLGDSNDEAGDFVQVVGNYTQEGIHINDHIGDRSHSRETSVVKDKIKPILQTRNTAGNSKQEDSNSNSEDKLPKTTGGSSIVGAREDRRKTGKRAPTGNTVTETQGKRKPSLCTYYALGICWHGKSGKTDGTCNYDHPRKCHAHMTTGKCKLPSCKLFHPEMCTSSVQERLCYNLNCQAYHLKGTKRYKTSRPWENLGSHSHSRGRGFLVPGRKKNWQEMAEIVHQIQSFLEWNHSRWPPLQTNRYRY